MSWFIVAHTQTYKAHNLKIDYKTSAAVFDHKIDFTKL